MKNSRLSTFAGAAMGIMALPAMADTNNADLQTAGVDAPEAYSAFCGNTSYIERFGDTDPDTNSRFTEVPLEESRDGILRRYQFLDQPLYIEQREGGQWYLDSRFPAYPECIEGAPESWHEAFAIIDQIDPTIWDGQRRLYLKDASDLEGINTGHGFDFGTLSWDAYLNEASDLGQKVTALLGAIRGSSAHFEISEAMRDVDRESVRQSPGCVVYDFPYAGPVEVSQVYTMAALAYAIGQGILSEDQLESVISQEHMNIDPLLALPNLIDLSIDDLQRIVIQQGQTITMQQQSGPGVNTVKDAMGCDLGRDGP